MVKRFPTYHVSIRVGRKTVASATVVARHVGAEVATDWPVFTVNKTSLGDILLLVIAQAYSGERLGDVANKELKKRGFGSPTPLAPTVEHKGDPVSDEDIERQLSELALDVDDIPF